MITLKDGTPCYESLDECLADGHTIAEINNIGPLIPISSGTAEMIAASESVNIEELPFDDIVVHPGK